MEAFPRKVVGKGEEVGRGCRAMWGNRGPISWVRGREKV